MKTRMLVLAILSIALMIPTPTARAEDEFPIFLPLVHTRKPDPRIAFVSSLYCHNYGNIYVMNADGSDQTNLTNSLRNYSFLEWSPNGTKIAFTVFSDQYDLYVMNADGSNLVRVVEDIELGFSPAFSWSPDGTQIAFVKDSDIHRIDAGGGTPIKLTSSPTVDKSSPAWSPNGAKIAYTGGPGDILGIYAMNADGSNQVRLTPQDVWGDSPQWSPDGKKIAFRNRIPLDIIPDYYFDIYVMNADGSKLVNVTNDPLRFCCSFQWSPDSKKIAIGRDDIYVVDANGENKINLTSSDEYENWPKWTLDGKKIVYTSQSGSDLELYSIFTMNTDGSNRTRLSDGHSPALSPDGRKIAFFSERDCVAYEQEIYSIKLDGSAKMNLSNHPAQDIGHAWSPDGKMIAFLSDRTGNNDIFVMQADGSKQVNLTKSPEGEGLPVWSPDGSMIAYSKLGYIFVMNARGGNQTQLSSNVSGANWLRWSPDGTRIGFISGYGLQTMNVDGSNLTTIVYDPELDIREFVWSPDGAKIVFQSYASNSADLFTVDASGGNPTKLTNSLINVFAREPAWSPDSSRIAFIVSSSNVDSVGGVYVMNADGSKQVNLTGNAGSIFADGPAWSPDGKMIAFGLDGDIFVMDSSGRNQTNLTNSLAYDSNPAWLPIP